LIILIEITLQQINIVENVLLFMQKQR